MRATKETVNARAEGKKKFPKSTPFIAASVAGILILIGSCNLLSKSNGKNRISFINNYRFNVTDFNNLVVPSFSVDGESESYDFNGEGTVDDNFTIKLNDGNFIIAPFDYALLIDTDFKMRNNNKLSKELGFFTKAKVNFFNEIKDMFVKALSIEQINGETFFLLDTLLGIDSVPENEVGIKRILGTPDNIIPYNELDPDKAKEKYKDVTSEFESADIVIDGVLNRMDDLYGYKEVEINGTQYMLICGEMSRTGLCIEFLISKDNCILYRTLNSGEGWEIETKGTPIQANGAKGLYNMQYKRGDGIYLNLHPIKGAILGDDGLYHLKYVGEFGGFRFSLFPSRYFSFEYNYGNKLTETEFNDAIELPYDQMFFSTESYSKPYLGEFKLVNLGKSSFYVGEGLIATDLSVKDHYGSGSKNPFFDGIYSIESVALRRGPRSSKSISLEDCIIPSDGFDVVFNLNNRSFGVVDDMGQLAGYKLVNINGIEYYAIITTVYNHIIGEHLYGETLIPANKVLLKGSEEILGPVKSRTK